MFSIEITNYIYSILNYRINYVEHGQTALLNHLAIRLILIGRKDMVLPPSRYSVVLSCFVLKKPKYIPMRTLMPRRLPKRVQSVHPNVSSFSSWPTKNDSVALVSILNSLAKRIHVDELGILINCAGCSVRLFHLLKFVEHQFFIICEQKLIFYLDYETGLNISNIKGNYVNVIKIESNSITIRHE